MTGWDENGEIRAVPELTTHPFFVATLFQHEHNARRSVRRPLVQAFLRPAIKIGSPGCRLLTINVVARPLQQGAEPHALR